MYSMCSIEAVSHIPTHTHTRQFRAERHTRPKNPETIAFVPLLLSLSQCVVFVFLYIYNMSSFRIFFSVAHPCMPLGHIHIN